MTVDEFARSGIVESCCRALRADGDVQQEVYLLILEKVARDGSEWLSEDWLNGYVYRMCRNMAYGKSSPYHTKFRRALLDDVEVEMEDTPDEIDCISDRLDDIWLLDAVTEFIERREPGEMGWYERELFWGWLETGSYRALEKDIKERTGHRISYQSISIVVRELIAKLTKEWLPQKGWRKINGQWTKY